MPSPFETKRRRAYVLAMLREQKRDAERGDPGWTYETLIVAACKRHGYTTSAAIVREDLDWMRQHDLVESREGIEESTGVAQTWWVITPAGIDVVTGAVRPPRGLE